MHRQLADGKQLQGLEPRAEEALAAAQEAAGLYRALAGARPEAFTPDLASSLNNLAIGLSELGWREEALAAAKEAVQIRRALATARPEVFTPDLAKSLNNLAAMLSAFGRLEEWLAAEQEAAALLTCA
jgi:tetratricopeptide (TPR) repeat protein